MDDEEDGRGQRFQQRANDARRRMSVSIEDLTLNEEGASDGITTGR